MSSDRPLIVHVVYRLDVGGLENGLVNLINKLPTDRYRHVIVSLTQYTDFHQRIEQDVALYALDKKPGNDLGLYWRLYKLFRELKPDIVHTRNLATLEAQLPAVLAGVSGRVHGEHGWDISDLGGASRKYRLLRACFKPLVKRYIPLSDDLETYLTAKVGVPTAKITKICNGVDTQLFRPADDTAGVVFPEGFAAPGVRVVGTVGRMEEVKNTLLLVRAVITLLESHPNLRTQLRLVLVGDGSLRDEARQLIQAAGIDDITWLPGARDDVPELIRAMNIFVLPSKAEGISNTILEAMASGVPVIATDVGGSRQLVWDGRSGYLVPSDDKDAMAEAIYRYIADPAVWSNHASTARDRALENFSLESMVTAYQSVYDQLLSS